MIGTEVRAWLRCGTADEAATTLHTKEVVTLVLLPSICPHLAEVVAALSVIHQVLAPLRFPGLAQATGQGSGVFAWWPFHPR